MQIEQLQVLVGYSCNGGERAKVKRMAPQWQLPLWVLFVEVGVGGKVILILGLVEGVIESEMDLGSLIAVKR